jgi:uncharacterized membrane protein
MRILTHPAIVPSLCSCANRVFNVLQFIPMANYPLFVNLLTTFAYLPTSLIYIFWAEWKYKDQLITPEAKAIPQRVWIIMGFLDSLAGVLQSLAVDKINNGVIVVLVLQSAIPVSMIISAIFLRQRYRMSQYMGALLVIAGLLIVLAPSFSSAGSGGSGVGIWSAVLILSCVPMCLSSVYKEKNLKDIEIDAIYLNFFVAVYQFVLSWPLLPPSAIASELPISDIGSNLWGGMKCFAGINTLASDDCSTGPLYTSLYIFFNLGYNILIILLIKFGGSNILWLSITASVPIADLIFAIPGIPGYQSLGWTIGVGLPVIMAGLISYRFFTQAREWFLKKFGYAQVSTNEDEASEA